MLVCKAGGEQQGFQAVKVENTLREAFQLDAFMSCLARTRFCFRVGLAHETPEDMKRKKIGRRKVRERFSFPSHS